VVVAIRKAARRKQKKSGEISEQKETKSYRPPPDRLRINLDMPPPPLAGGQSDSLYAVTVRVRIGRNRWH
jgi:hypothetical protein